MSGFCNLRPPPLPNSSLPDVIAAPSGVKKMRRGPSELYSSSGLATPPVNSPPSAVPTPIAATEIVLAPALWPTVAPAVARRERLVSMRRARASPE
jgi:hypothetical protein